MVDKGLEQVEQKNKVSQNLHNSTIFQNKGEYSICNAFPLYNKNPFATEGLEMLASKYVRGGKRRPEKISRTDRSAGGSGDTDEGNAAASHQLFYPQLGVKLCSMAGGGVQKIYSGCFKTNRPAGQVRQ